MLKVESYIYKCLMEKKKKQNINKYLQREPAGMLKIEIIG